MMSDIAIETLRKFTVEEFHRLAETGVLHDRERVELLDGLLVEMSRIGQRHWARHARVAAYLSRTLGEEALVVGQGSFPLGTWNEPQPDIAILAPKPYERRGEVFAPADIFAIVELSDTSLGKDTGGKMRLYARFAIPDYLVVDLTANVLQHYRTPGDVGYVERRVYRGEESFVLERLPQRPLAAPAFLDVPS